MDESELELALEKAGADLAAGNLESAEIQYRTVLEENPGQPDAAYGLGIVALQTGYAEEAAELLQTAAIGAPEEPIIQCHLGLAWRTLDDFPKAEASYRKALALKPGHRDSQINLANLYIETDRLEEAEKIVTDYLDAEPNDPAGHYAMGLIHAQRGQGLAAIRAFERAIEYAPDLLPARVNLANLLLLSGDRSGAIDQLETAVAQSPDSFDAKLNLCAALQQADRTTEAVTVAHDALALAPESPELLLNLGAAEMTDGRPEDAWRTLDRALGVAPDYAPAKLNRGMARFLMGDLPGAWSDYESRPSRGVLPHPDIAEIPEWHGEDIAGRSIIVWAEQGYGDVIQFARYLPHLTARGAAVYFDVPPPLAPLFRENVGLAGLIVRDRDETLPTVDFQIPVLSLPHRFETALETIPAEIPYLDCAHAPPADLPAGLKVGLCWQGSESNPNDHRRSIDPSLLIDSLEYAGAPPLIGLQYDVADPPIPNPGGAVTDFGGMAALIKEVDLVISVDTGVAHLAGALGKPVWVLLPFAPDWRWMTDRADSPWYPTMRLFRQSRPGDWPGVLDNVRAALKDWAARTE